MLIPEDGPSFVNRLHVRTCLAWPGVALNLRFEDDRLFQNRILSFAYKSLLGLSKAKHYLAATSVVARRSDSTNRWF